MSPPSSGEKPTGLRRAPTDPKILDETPEPTVLVQRRFDRPQPRKATMPGLAPVRLPGAPELPLEHQPTKPAPPRVDAGPTLRATPELGQEATSPESAAGGQLAALIAERDRLLAEKTELERQARVRTESQQPGPYQPPVTGPERTTKPPESAASEGSTRALRSAVTKLVLGLAALLALLAVPLTAYIQALTTKIERSTAQAQQATARADAVEAKADTKIKEQVASDKEFRQYRANRRELDRLQGIEYPKVDGDPEPNDLEPYAPLCAPGKVCPGPQLILRRAP